MLTTIRRQRLAATTTAAAGLALTATAVVAGLTGLAVLGASAACFGVTAVIALRPRDERREQGRARVSVMLDDDPTSLAWPVEPATWTDVDGWSVFDDGSFCRTSSWLPRAAA